MITAISAQISPSTRKAADVVISRAPKTAAGCLCIQAADRVLVDRILNPNKRPPTTPTMTHTDAKRTAAAFIGPYPTSGLKAGTKRTRAALKLERTIGSFSHENPSLVAIQSGP